MTRRILALYDSANAEQSETVRLARKGGPHPQVGSLYLLSVGIWLCPVEVPEGFPSEVMTADKFLWGWYDKDGDKTLNAAIISLDALPDTYRVVAL